ANQRDGGLRILFHDPVPGARDHAFLDVARGKAHHRRHGRPERFLAAERQDRDAQLARREKGLVVGGVLIEGGELREARMPGAGAGIELRVVPARRLAEAARPGRELVPEAVEIDALAAGDEALHVGAAEAEMPEQRVLEYLLPWADAGQWRVDDDK